MANVEQYDIFAVKVLSCDHIREVGHIVQKSIIYQKYSVMQGSAIAGVRLHVLGLETGRRETAEQEKSLSASGRLVTSYLSPLSLTEERVRMSCGHSDLALLLLACGQKSVWVKTDDGGQGGWWTLLFNDEVSHTLSTCPHMSVV